MKCIFLLLALLGLGFCDGEEDMLEPYIRAVRSDGGGSADIFSSGSGSGSGSGDAPQLTSIPPVVLPSSFISLLFTNLTQEQFLENVEDTFAYLIQRLLGIEMAPVLELNASGEGVVSKSSNPASITVRVYFLNAAGMCSELENYASTLRSTQDPELKKYGLSDVQVQCESVNGSIPWWHWLIISISAFIGMSGYLLIIIACCCRYRSKKKQPRSASYFQTTPQSHFLLHESTIKEETRRELVRKISRVSFQSRTNAHFYSHPLSISDLGTLLTNPSPLLSEYATVPSNMVTMAEIPAGAEDKNRYRDVLPNPQTRVALFLKFGVSNSDYINANYIRGYKGASKAYIASQGPLQWTVADFWRMVWEQKCSTIIMATRLEEKGMLKCVQYWPENKHSHSIVYEELEVILKRRVSNATYSITTLLLRHKSKMVSREVTHFWFTGWPDHGVPSSPREVIDFIIHVRKYIRDIPGPAVVHCSAGIGRTGVFIAADIGMQQIDEQGEIDVLRILSSLRQDRGGMIQTKQQYVFLHQVLLEYATSLAKFNLFGRVSQRLESTQEEEVTMLDNDNTLLLSS